MMGVKSTRELTRKKAEELYVILKKELSTRIFLAEAVSMSDNDIEDVLEQMNDNANDGEGFENYRIIMQY